MRILIVLLILVATFDLSIGSSVASETTMRKSPAEELKSVLTKLGDRFRKTQAAMDA